MKKLKVTQPKDLKAKLKPLEISKVKTEKPRPPKVKVRWYEVIFALWEREDEDNLLDRLGGGKGRSISWFSLAGILTGNWKVIWGVVLAIVLTYLGFRIWG